MSKVLILTNCAGCGKAIDLKAPRCGRCHTRYCGPSCQAQHWNEGGHEELCKQIKKRGGAEEYHADQKYKEAVAVTVEACAGVTKGKTCFICTEAVVRRTGEGLVSGFCACRGSTSFAHVSCLVRQAQLVVDDELSNEDFYSKFSRWFKCRLCGQKFVGGTRCALGWACWRTYVNAPDEPGRLSLQLNALKQLANGHSQWAANEAQEEAIRLYNIGVDIHKRCGPSGYEGILQLQQNMSLHSAYR